MTSVWKARIGLPVVTIMMSLGCSSGELLLPLPEATAVNGVNGANGVPGMPAGPPLASAGDVAAGAAPTLDCGARIYVTELNVNPRRVPDRRGEYVELYNGSSRDIDLRGWQLGDGDRELHIIRSHEPVLVPSGGFIVLGPEADSELNGGITVNYEYSDITLSNEADRVRLVDACGESVADVVYPTRTRWGRTRAGYSMELAVAPGRSPARWRRARRRLPSGDRGSPGRASWPRKRARR